ncbi:unnamed protein product [Heterobilharzia americana]|nr:unnamed protein product [Heterobilharzia americana]CAH8667155.1 unnamed protein product [Heterobilharzia americana]
MGNRWKSPKSVFLGSCVSASGVTNEIANHKLKARAVYANLSCLWCLRDVHLVIKEGKYIIQSCSEPMKPDLFQPRMSDYSAFSITVVSKASLASSGNPI